MNKVIHRLIESNSVLKYYYTCYLHSKIPEYRSLVLNVRNNPYLVEVTSYGNKNYNKAIYHISINKPKEGFCAVLRRTIDLLYFADYFNFIPYIEYKNFLYEENSQINGSNNPFEYYFRPVSVISSDEIVAAHNVFLASERHAGLIEKLNETTWSYVITQEYIDKLGGTVKKYLALNSDTERYIETSQKHIFNGGRILGVHARGTDYKQLYRNHPNFVTSADYFLAIDEIMRIHEIERIFLATDDSEMLKEFKDRYKEKLVYYSDVCRSNSCDGVHVSKVERENHHFNLGLEILRDMYTLAKCDGLVASMSQVGICAQIINGSHTRQFLVRKILDKGIVKKGRYY